jgi:hypothetical protein
VSKLCKLQHLKLRVCCFSRCTSNGLAAVLATITGIYAAGSSAVWAVHTMHRFVFHRCNQLRATAFNMPVRSTAVRLLSCDDAGLEALHLDVALEEASLATLACLTALTALTAPISRTTGYPGCGHEGKLVHGPAQAGPR